MKYTLTLLIAVIFLSCSDSPTNETLDDENFIIQKLENVENEPWSSGNYVTTNEIIQPPSSLQEARETLKSLMENGFQLDKAWFKEGASSCGLAQVVVPTELVVRVKISSFEAIDSTKMEEFNELFKPIDTNTVFMCAKNESINVYEITPRIR